MPPRARCRSRRRRAAGWCRRTARSGCRRCRNMPSTCWPISRCGRCISISAGCSARRAATAWTQEFVVRVSPLLHQAILALFDDRSDPDRTALLLRLAMLELHQAEDSATFIPLPHEPRCRRAADIVLADPTGRPRDRDAGARGRHLGADAVAAVLVGDAIELQELVPARPHRRRHRKTVDGCQRLGQAACLRSGLCQRAGVFPCLPAGYRQDADGIRRRRSELCLTR